MFHKVKIFIFSVDSVSVYLYAFLPFTLPHSDVHTLLWGFFTSLGLGNPLQGIEIWGEGWKCWKIPEDITISRKFWVHNWSPGFSLLLSLETRLIWAFRAYSSGSKGGRMVQTVNLMVGRCRWIFSCLLASPLLTSYCEVLFFSRPGLDFPVAQGLGTTALGDVWFCYWLYIFKERIWFSFFPYCHYSDPSNSVLYFLYTGSVFCLFVVIVAFYMILWNVLDFNFSHLIILRNGCRGTLHKLQRTYIAPSI